MKGILGKGEKKEKEVLTPAQIAANARFALMKQQYQQQGLGGPGTSPSAYGDGGTTYNSNCDMGGYGGGEYLTPSPSISPSPSFTSSPSVSPSTPKALPPLPPKATTNKPSSVQLLSVPAATYTPPAVFHPPTSTPLYTAPASYPAPSSSSSSPNAVTARHFSDQPSTPYAHSLPQSVSPRGGANRSPSPIPMHPHAPQPQPQPHPQPQPQPQPQLLQPQPQQFHTRLNFSDPPQIHPSSSYDYDNQYQYQQQQPQPIDFGIVVEELEYDTQNFVKLVSTLEGMVMQIGSKMNDSRSLRGIIENQKLVINQVIDHLTYFFQELDKTSFAQTEFVNRFYSARNDFDRCYNIYQLSLSKHSEAIVRYPDPPERSRASTKFTKQRNAGRKVSIYGDQQLQALDGFQFDLSKMMEYDEAEEERKFIEQRNKEIQMLLLELEELRDIFADQADMMVQQGELLETVSRQTEAAELATRQAVVELAKAQSIDFSRYTKRAMLIGALLGGAAGAVGGMMLLGPVASIPLGLVGAAAGAYIGKKVGGMVVSRLTRTAERQLFQTHLQAAGKWMRDKDVPACLTCKHPFTTFRRRTHCRGCGGIFCHPCCGHMMVVKMETITYDTPVQVCSNCYQSQG